MQPRINIETASSKKNWLVFGLLLICLILISIVALESDRFLPAPQTVTSKPDQRFSVAQSPVFDYGALGGDKEAKELMEDRKAKYNIENSVDMIVRSDETLKINNKTIRMRDIIEKAKLVKGEIVESDLMQNQEGLSDDKTEYGIYVVHPRDNIWNIHYNLLKDYFGKKGVTLGPGADRPRPDGKSSGVGKLLKFSEKMVYIYNIDEKKIDTEIHLIQPLSKIVVYNMKEIFTLLEGIDYSQVDQIQFDGENLWMSADPPSEPSDPRH